MRARAFVHASYLGSLGIKTPESPKLETQALLYRGNASFGLSGTTLVVGAGERFAGFNRNLEIELNLRLGTRWANRNLKTTLREVLEYV